MVAGIVRKLLKFRNLIDIYIDIYKNDASRVANIKESVRIESVESVDFISDNVRKVIDFYIKHFLENKFILVNEVYIIMLQNIIKEVRKYFWIPIPKKYAQILKISMDKNEKIGYE